MAVDSRSAMAGAPRCVGRRDEGQSIRREEARQQKGWRPGDVAASFQLAIGRLETGPTSLGRRCRTGISLLLADWPLGEVNNHVLVGAFRVEHFDADTL